ncbi:acyltransferase [Pseudomonas sp. NPDC089395]|uniref:acyltransferase n=1 Tax=Pseudomonas sp. NPDC089395 TaxID=3364460 RepID=UPI00382D4B09
MTDILVSGNYEDDMGNRVIAPAGLHKVYVDFKGKNNTLHIESNSGIKNTLISFPSDSGVCAVGAHGNYCGKIRIGWKCTVVVGSDVTCTTACAIYTAESTCTIIGDDCMIAAHVIIRTEDSHAIFDVESGNRLNPSRDVIIGQHVWLAEDSVILSGSRIGSGSVIGIRSVVKASIPNNCTAAGIPCKAIKRNTAWERPNIAFSDPWIRTNAREQALIEANQSWQLTDDNATHIKIGKYSYMTIKDLQTKNPNLAPAFLTE